MQDKVTGVMNCCSCEPISIRRLVEKYCVEKNKSIDLNLGYYHYPDYEPMEFWGNIEELKNALNG